MVRSALAVLAAVLALAPPAEGRTFDSRYSRFDYASCPEGKTPEPGIIEVRICRGLGPIDVVWTAEPDSSEVRFGTDTPDEVLGLGDFHEAGDTVEWRLRSRNGRATAIAAIIRYWTGTNIGRLDRSRLVVYRIEPSGRSCVIGLVDSSRPNANAEARQIADRWSADFVCGVSARR
ncbi:hypothetical protein C3941_12850 [Kaistia algarum]|uniref:hypothetical protein n=1 Tax=Kaistia algarum TaxID=2083279 RepID=UPI000CE7D0EE|nr:hypothetical protein [Kaistia algarum]MCX5515241.1 hypothetical protein [Kaistia algarum]PPE79951.1 hypothetical protein C3941_12850 [Kaistia algarum]